jgi:hypothetical protein
MRCYKLSGGCMVVELFISYYSRLRGYYHKCSWNMGSFVKIYSGISNVMLLAETEDRISTMKQGKLPLMDYVAALKRLWADVDHFDPIELPHTECVVWIKKWIEKRRVLQFLRSLNPEF